jgi:hypothetical protein
VQFMRGAPGQRRAQHARQQRHRFLHRYERPLFPSDDSHNDDMWLMSGPPNAGIHAPAFSLGRSPAALAESLCAMRSRNWCIEELCGCNRNKECRHIRYSSRPNQKCIERRDKLN